MPLARCSTMRILTALTLLAATVGLMNNQSRAADAAAMKTNLFFHAEKLNGRWWLISPDGHRFISKGVTTVQVAQDTIQGTDKSPYLEERRVGKEGRSRWSPDQ